MNRNAEREQLAANHASEQARLREWGKTVRRQYADWEIAPPEPEEAPPPRIDRAQLEKALLLTATAAALAVASFLIAAVVG